MGKDKMILKEIANLLLEENDEIYLKEIEEARQKPISVSTKRNDNAFIREEIGSNKLIYPEADNAFERMRSALYLKNPDYPRISRLYKSRRRRGVL